MDYRINLSQTLYALTVFTVLGLITASTVVAQQQSPQQQAPNVDVSGEELESTAQAYVIVQDILEQYRAKLGQTQDPDEASAIQQEMRSETDAAIEEQGLAPERYDKIIRAARADEDLRRELLTLVKELQDEGSGG